MSGQDVNLSSESIDDELNVFGWNTLDGFLNDVVTVLILDAFEDIGAEFLDEFGLLISKDMFESLMVD
jgi:hypothetical protein